MVLVRHLPTSMRLWAHGRAPGAAPRGARDLGLRLRPCGRAVTREPEARPEVSRRCRYVEPFPRVLVCPGRKRRVNLHSGRGSLYPLRPRGPLGTRHAGCQLWPQCAVRCSVLQAGTPGVCSPMALTGLLSAAGPVSLPAQSDRTVSETSLGEG